MPAPADSRGKRQGADIRARIGAAMSAQTEAPERMPGGGMSCMTDAERMAKPGATGRNELHEAAVKSSQPPVG